MIVIVLNAGTGNQLFQFALGYILTKSNSLNVFYSVPQVGRSKLDFFSLGWRVSLLKFSNYRKIIGAVSHSILNLSVVNMYSCLECVDIKSICDNSILDGYFQDGGFFRKYQDNLRNKLKIKAKYENRFKDLMGHRFFSLRSLVVHIRRTDYKYAYFQEIDSTALLPLEWFSRMLESILCDSYDVLYVVSDDINEVKDCLDWEPYNAIFFNGIEADHFQLIMNADIAIISNSSFAWWAAFLNSKAGKRVIAPKYWVGYHVKKEYPTGIMIDQFEWRE